MKILIAYSTIIFTIVMVSVPSIPFAKSSKFSEFELTGCDAFLKTSEEVCIIKFSKINVNVIQQKLNFKSKNHEGAFWLGFSIFNMLECEKFTRANGVKNSGRPENIFQSYFLNTIDISRGLNSTKENMPYALSYLAGDSFYYFIIDNFSQQTACELIIKTAGPRGRFGNWVKVLN